MIISLYSLTTGICLGIFGYQNISLIDCKALLTYALIVCLIVAIQNFHIAFKTPKKTNCTILPFKRKKDYGVFFKQKL